MKSKILILILIAFFSAHKSNAQEQADSLYDYLVTIHTDYGKIRLILFDDTPEHKANFIKLAKGKVYNHQYFHRIINNFMIQAGEPRTRNKAIDYDPSIIQPSVTAEFHEHYDHSRGYIGAARRGKDKNPQLRSNGTQFYIIQGLRGAHHLDGKYTIFGKVMSGMEVVDKIAATPTDEKDRPQQKIRLTMTVEKILREELAKFYNYPVH